jgi:hypothetical protein
MLTIGGRNFFFRPPSEVADAARTNWPKASGPWRPPFPPNLEDIQPPPWEELLRPRNRPDAPDLWGKIAEALRMWGEHNDISKSAPPHIPAGSAPNRGGGPGSRARPPSHGGPGAKGGPGGLPPGNGCKGRKAKNPFIICT